MLEKMTSSDPDSWVIPSLPFVWRPLLRSTNDDGLPDYLPFELGMDSNTGCVIQKPNELVTSALADAYAKGSILSGLMDEDGIGQQYAEDFLAFIYRAISRQNLSDLKVLEIGCGNGYLLKRMRDSGAEVLGVEPGEHGQSGSEKWGVPIVHGTFPTPEIEGLFDLVVAFAVLEHIENPQTFLSQIKANLKPNGIVVIAVPDEGPYIDNGDISTLFHEHWSFFDEITLLTTSQLAGYNTILSTVSGFGGSIYCAMKTAGEISMPQPKIVAASFGRAQNYIKGAHKNCDKFASYCRGILEKNRTLGIYVPGRAVNALAVSNLPLENIRFFDDNPLLAGTYFPGIDIPVESRNLLLSKPTDHVLIMSRTFGKKLAKELRRDLPRNTVVEMISEILK
jgi:hypothetical protein